MYTLYYAPGAASFAVHWMLIELDQPFELKRVDFARREQKSPEYLDLNPKGQVPTLIVDGKPYAETAALLMLLAERHPEAGLAPAPGSESRAKYLELMVFMANGMLPAFRSLFYPEDFGAPGQAEDIKANARARIEAGFDLIDRQLADGRTFLLGDNLTAADILATMLARWSRNMPRPAQSWTNIGGYLERIKRQPGLRQVHERERLTDWIEPAPAD